MLQTIRERALPALFTAVVGALLAIGLLLPVLRAIDIAGTGMALWACILTSLACAIWGLGGKFRWIGLGVGGFLLLVMMLMTGALRNMSGMLGAAFHLIRGNVSPLRVYGPEAAMLASILLSIATFAMARQSAGFYPALSLTMVALLIIWFSNHRDAVALFAPALIALCAMFARSAGEETPVLRILIVSALAVILALMVSPLLQFRSSALENLADQLRTYITDTMFFTESRSVYSIQVDGYKPLETRLGGPVTLTDQPVMTVETPTSVLLRGTIYNEYNGLNWSDTLATRRYLYTDIRNRSLRADTLDEQRPPQEMRTSTIFRQANIRITMQSDSASTLFAPQRSQELATPMALVPYFNMSSELFITRNLMAGDVYSMQAPIINANDERLPDVLMQAHLGNSETRDMSKYLTLPDKIADEVYAITEQLTAGAGSPYEQARAIQLYLRGFRYTLAPEVPPANQDFVSFFLLRGKEGYCTYFASAMAVMGRIAGLPTRYVEGYVAEPSGGTALVTSKSAHAWAEVYFEGFGWVAFDATPSQGQGGPRISDGTTEWQQQQDDQGEPPPEEGQDEQSEEMGEGEQSETTPEPDSPEGGDDGDQLPDPTGDFGGEPSSDEQEQDEPSPDESDEPEGMGDSPEDDLTATGQSGPKNPGYWWVWLLLIALAGLLVWRVITTRPEMIVSKAQTDGDKLLAWYRALLGMLAAAGMPARPYETPVAYALRVEKGVPKEAGFLAVAETITMYGYSRMDEVNPSEVQAAATCYGKVAKALPVKGRVKWFFRRLLHGLGSVGQLP